MANVTKKRELTISARGRAKAGRRTQWIPEIKLAGKWLEAAGFSPGEMVEIMVSNGSINITAR